MGRCIAFSLGLLLVASLLGQEPKKKDQPEPLKALYTTPLAIIAGGKGTLSVRGVRLDQLQQISSSVGQWKLMQKQKKAGPNNYPAEKVGDSEATVEWSLPKDFTGDVVELRNPAGPLLKVLVDRTPAIAEKEPNDSFAQAQELPIPAVVNGLIHRERDVDVFKFSGQAGQMVQVEVIAAKLGAPSDTLLTLYDANRRTLASVDDVNGSPDPAISFKLPATGFYFLSVIESHDAGGPMFPYRLVLK